MPRKLSTLGVVFLSTFILQCSQDKGPIGDVTIDVIPSSPIALDAPVTLFPGTDQEITYDRAVVNFGLRGTLDAGSKYHAVVVAFNVTYRNVSTGEILEDSFEAGEFDKEFFFSLAPGGQSVIVDGSGDLIRFYTGGLPRPPFGDPRYRVDVEILGWFTKLSACDTDGDPTCSTSELLFEQSRRLNKRLSFSTQ